MVADVRERPQGRGGGGVHVGQVLRHRQAGPVGGCRVAGGAFLHALQVDGALDPLLRHVPGQPHLRLGVVEQERPGHVAEELGALPVGVGPVGPLLMPDRHGRDPAVGGRAGRAAVVLLALQLRGLQLIGLGLAGLAELRLDADDVVLGPLPGSEEVVDPAVLIGGQGAAALVGGGLEDVLHLGGGLVAHLDRGLELDLDAGDHVIYLDRHGSAPSGTAARRGDGRGHGDGWACLACSALIGGGRPALTGGPPAGAVRSPRVPH